MLWRGMFHPTVGMIPRPVHFSSGYNDNRCLVIGRRASTFLCALWYFFGNARTSVGCRIPAIGAFQPNKAREASGAADSR